MKHTAPLAAIAAAFAIGALAIEPLRDVPIVDDWVYAWSVRHLITTGELRVAEISAVYPIVQILWGSLFAHAFGFSFGILRLSTITIAVAGCAALYFTLLELGCSLRWSALGALALAVHPVYFSLAFSFMTDVPATALSLIALMFIVQAVRRDRPQRLWAAALFILAAFLVRAPAVILLVAPIIVVDWRRPDRMRWAAPIATGVAAATILWVVLHRAMGSLAVESGRLEQLQWLTLVSPGNYLRWNLGLFWESAIPLAPLLLASATAARQWRRVLLAAVPVGMAVWFTVGGLPMPLADWATWSLQDIGGGRALIGQQPPVSAWSTRVTPFVSGVGLTTATSLLVALMMAVSRWSRPLIVVLCAGALNFLVINVLWLYVDRYYLALAPVIVCIAAAHAARVNARTSIAAGLIVALWLVSVSGTRDMLDVNDTVAQAAHDLEAAGVPPWDIDAGWALNGWRLWAHPERLPPGVDRRHGVPYVTSKVPTTYMISSAPVADYDVIRVLPLPHAWWQATDRLYVLRRRGVG